MSKLPVESDTNRIPYNNKSPYQVPDESRKNYRKLILKILPILLILVVLIAICIILIKIFVLDKSNKNCSEGFFHPDDEENKNSCYACKLSNCKTCQGKKTNNLCTECNMGFNPEYNDKNEIIRCSLENSEYYNDIKCGEYCLECNKDEKICSKCHSGYFVPDDSNDKLLCEKCSLTNCEKCEGKKNNDICVLCKDNYISKNDINNKIEYCNEKCKEGENEKCKECDLNKNECLNCNSGFYLPSDDDIKLECKSCSLEHCQICHGTKSSNICDSCEKNYEPELENNIIKLCKYKSKAENCEIGEGEKCLTCDELETNKCGSCNPSYKLVDGKCIFENDISPSEELEKTEKVKQTEETEKDQQIKPTEKIQEIKPTEKVEEVKPTEIKQKETDEVQKEEEEDSNPDYDFVSFTAKYISEENNEKTPIIKEGKNNYIKQMKVDGILKEPNVDNEGHYLFENNSGNEHTVKIWLEINEDILQDLFERNINLKYIKFNRVQNSKNIAMTSMKNMFADCVNLTSVDISKLDTKYVETMETMFYNCSSLTFVDLSKNNFKNVEVAFGLFAYCASLISVNLNTAFPNLEEFDRAFYRASSIKSLDLSKINSGNLKDITYMLGYCYSLEYVNLSNFKTDQVESMKCLFYYDYKLTSVDLSQFDTKKVTDMRWMFYYCKSLTYLDLSSFDTSEVTDMFSMFCTCESLTSINFGNHFSTAKVTNMSFMFDTLASLKNLDLRHFNTKNVENMQYMFRDCCRLKSIDVSSFDTSQVTKFDQIFLNCSSLTSLDLSNFNFTTSSKYYTSPRIMYYCQSLKYIDITPIDFIFRDFFTGIPTSGGKIRASRKLVNQILSMGIKVLVNWDWEIIG